MKVTLLCFTGMFVNQNVVMVAVFCREAQFLTAQAMLFLITDPVTLTRFLNCKLQSVAKNEESELCVVLITK